MFKSDRNIEPGTYLVRKSDRDDEYTITFKTSNSKIQNYSIKIEDRKLNMMEKNMMTLIF